MQDADRATIAGIPADRLDYLISTAGRAPSIHNSQPWQFRLDGDSLALRIAVDRPLPVADPAARELVLSCGAALFNLRIGLRHLGLTPQVQLAPDPGDPLLMARVRAVPGPDQTAAEAALHQAVHLRHTHRGGFDDIRLPAELRAALVRAAGEEGARLRWLAGPGQARAVVRLAREAEQRQAGDPHWRAELARWVNRDPAGQQREGIPINELYRSWRPEPDDALPARRFGLPPFVGQRTRGRPGLPAVLTTPGDTVPDWLAAGQALEHLLLRAAAHWVFATFATPALEFPDLREQVRDALGLADHPQMLLELGRAGQARLTPRRPAGATLTR